MNILAFCLFPFPSISLWRTGHFVFERTTPHEGMRGEILLPTLVEEALQHMPLADIDLVMTFGGPGPFTALRTTLAFLKGLTMEEKERKNQYRVLTPSFFQVLGHTIPEQAFAVRISDQVIVYADHALENPSRVAVISSGVFPGVHSPPSALLCAYGSSLYRESVDPVP